MMATICSQSHIFTYSSSHLAYKFLLQWALLSKSCIIIIAAAPPPPRPRPLIAMSLSPSTATVIAQKLGFKSTGVALYCAGVSAFTALIYWRYNVAIRTRLFQSELRLRAATSQGFQECRATLKGVQDAWDNVEQTRSVARLDGAMKTCLGA
eukprot:gene11387-7892_t